jgi:methylenetetrahydrofolate dehydrogenase (NADP+) / methenyltetrahydrofolate cyclohydrolase
MSAVVFNGRELADKLKREMKKKINRKLKLVTFYNPNHKPSVIYTNVKARAAEELGIEFEKIQFSDDKDKIKAKIRELNQDRTVNGIMIQLPFSGKEEDRELIGEITPEKDVDGLREDSPFVPATVRAVYEIMREAGVGQETVAVVGSEGMVGKKLVKYLTEKNYQVIPMDKTDFDGKLLKGARVIISATGQKGLIRPEMVNEGVIAIDVGFPEGDFDPAVASKAAFFTPVPGGVGPVTVVCLFKNLAQEE